MRQSLAGLRQEVAFCSKQTIFSPRNWEPSPGQWAGASQPPSQEKEHTCPSPRLSPSALVRDDWPGWAPWFSLPAGVDRCRHRGPCGTRATLLVS